VELALPEPLVGPSGDEPAGAAWPEPPVAAPGPGAGWAAPRPIPGAPTPPPAARPPASAGGGGAGATAAGRSAAAKVGCALVPLLIGVAVVAVIGSALRSCDPGGTGGLLSGSNQYDTLITLSGTTTVLGVDGDTTDVVATTQSVEGSDLQRRLTRLEITPTEATVVWQSDELPEDTSRAQVAVVGDTLFAGIGDQVHALDEATGETRWTAELSDVVTLGCQDCFSAVDDLLVVRTRDAYVTAFSPRSAEARWWKRLRSPSGSIATPDGHLLVVDEPEDPTALTAVTALDPTTGEARRSVRPTCPKGDGGTWEVEVAPGDLVLAVPASTDVVATFGFGDGCVVRWNPDDGTVRWTSRLNGTGSIDDAEVVVGPSDLVLPLGSTMVTVDLATGEALQLEVPAEAQAAPDLVLGRTLVANTVTTRGTPRHGLAAWDLRSGQRRWVQLDLGAAAPVSRTPYFTGDALFSGSPRSLLVAEGDEAGDGVSVLVFDGDQGTFSSQPLDLATGDLGPEVRRAYARDSSGIPSLTVEAVEGDRVLVTIDSLLQSLPVDGRGEIVTFPDQ
jgi:outer membrane protein assembly factor BamB